MIIGDRHSICVAARLTRRRNDWARSCWHSERCKSAWESGCDCFCRPTLARHGPIDESGTPWDFADSGDELWTRYRND